MITRFNYFGVLLFLFIQSFVQAQNIQLVNSGEVIKQAILLYDSGRYDDAISLFTTVPKQDTNYVYMLSELALTLNAAEKYEESITVCLEGLQKPSLYRSHLLGLLGTAYDHNEQLEKSIETYQLGIKEYPLDYLLHFNLGITYYNSKDYGNAERSFHQALKLNPYHSSSHLNLGRLSAFQGNKVRAMMCFGVYLSLANADNERLVFLERLLNNEIPDEGTFPYSGVNSFQKLDQIIRAKVVNEKSFKSKIPVNAMTVKQFELLLDQLDLVDVQPNDFWVEYYLPFYQEIKEKKLIEPFLYHILSSTNIESVQKWRQKNEKALASFYDAANAWLVAMRSELEVPAEWEMGNLVQAWYVDGKLEGIGKKDQQGNRLGKWKYFYNHHELQAEGEYDQSGNKTGKWNYYYSTGILRSSEIESPGSTEVKQFSERGFPNNHYNIKNGNVEGDVDIFYPCGTPIEYVFYKAGKKEGEGKLFFPSGDVQAVYNFTNDQLDGTYKVNYQSGSTKELYQYKEGSLSGKYTYYFPSGKLKISGQYEDGLMEGAWQYYFENGRLEKEGSYLKGELNDKWNFYNQRGELEEERAYQDKEIHGISNLYRNGKKFCVNEYQLGKLMAVTYLDLEGNVIGKFGDPSGTFEVKGYYPEGQLLYEGSITDGKEQGDWNYFYREGMKKYEYRFEEGKLQGPHKEFFRTGQLKFEQTFEHGELHGYSSEYFINGTLKHEGWYQNGIAEQRWYSYYPDGTKESENYFMNGHLAGISHDYNVDGKLFVTNYYEDGDLSGIEFYNQAGTMTIAVPNIHKTEVAKTTFKNGALNLQLDFLCHQLEKVTRGWPNGKKQLEIQYENGKRSGVYQSYSITGKLEVTGRYTEGELSDKWVWYYPNGNLSQVGFYLNGERDSLWIDYNSEGWVESEISYVNGKLDGIRTTYAPDGSILYQKMYSQGDLISYRLMKEGKLGTWQPFTGNDHLVVTFANGKKAYEATYQDGLLHGITTMYFPTGKILAQRGYEKGDYEGETIYYYQNGKVKEKGTYRWDEREGISEYYNEEGLLTHTEEYKMGIEQGKSMINNGVNKVEYNYWAGELVE